MESGSGTNYYETWKLTFVMILIQYAPYMRNYFIMGA